MIRSTGSWRPLALLLLASLVLAACGDFDGSSDETGGEQTTSTAVRT